MIVMIGLRKYPCPLQLIVSSRSGQRSRELDDSTDDGTVSSDGSMTTDRSRLRSSDGIHLNFRLWLTTRSDIGRLIPGGWLDGGGGINFLLPLFRAAAVFNYLI